MTRPLYIQPAADLRQMLSRPTTAAAPGEISKDRRNKVTNWMTRAGIASDRLQHLVTYLGRRRMASYRGFQWLNIDLKQGPK